jgi:flagellar M-ring protein FliF
VGFELFDRTNLGATDFTQRLNFQRALQGELMRTINRLEGVTESRVHIAMPERRLFSEQEEAITASVVLHLRPGYSLEPRQVAGIVHLVSSSVEGLKPQNVTVIDPHGDLLKTGNSPSVLSSSQVELQEGYERRLEAQLRRLADEVLGPGKAAIRVSADLNWDQMETTSETYRPSGLNGKNLPVEVQARNETYGRRSNRPAAGVPGVSSNLGRPVLSFGSSAGGEPGQYANSDTRTSYAVSKVVERRVAAPGKIRRISIAVLLDGTIRPTQQTALKNAFAAAAGLDLEPVSAGGRGDRIELLPIAFDRSAEAQADRAADEATRQSFRIALIRHGTAVAVVILVLVIGLLLLRQLRTAQQRGLDALISDAGALPSAPSSLPKDRERVSPDVRIQEIAANPGGALELPQAVRQLAAARPEEVARELKRWMAEEK